MNEKIELLRKRMMMAEEQSYMTVPLDELVELLHCYDTLNQNVMALKSDYQDICKRLDRCLARTLKHEIQLRFKTKDQRILLHRR